MDGYELIGTFEVKSGALVVSDPCYAMDEDHFDVMGIIPNADDGTWEAYVKFDDGDVMELCVLHTDLDEDVLGTYAVPECAVDSGQLGIFCFGSYPDPEKGEKNGKYGEEGSFYNDCCKLTGEKSAYGIVRGSGVVSRSGMGDGFYTAYVTRDLDGFARRVSVVFIEDGGEEEDCVCDNCKKEAD